nr:ImmA/IrrE family metallo-endopeptidase [Bacteroidota bacterium]
MKVAHNISRLKYLLELYNISAEELSSIISAGLKNPVTIGDIFSHEIKISHLKRIDQFFNKGLSYYLDPKAPETSREASIFFRKEKFNSDLNIGTRKIVNEFEEIKISLSAISKLSDLNTDRAFRLYKLSDNPAIVANEIRNQLYPDFTTNLKEFLKALISKFAESNILVFEFVETWNKKEKTNIDGFFLNPNVIVLKRQQASFRREIFTLIHELGHFLLDEEEIEKLDYQNIGRKDLSAIERWCNVFAFRFLAGEYGELMDNIEVANASNDYHYDLIEHVSKKTNLSQIALFTRLLYDNKISQNNYSKIKVDFDSKYFAKLEEEKRKREIEKQKGIKQRGSAAQPIQSPLFISTIQTAFYEGILNEYEVCQRLKIKPEKLDQYIS